MSANELRAGIPEQQLKGNRARGGRRACRSQLRVIVFAEVRGSSCLARLDPELKFRQLVLAADGRQREGRDLTLRELMATHL